MSPRVFMSHASEDKERFVVAFAAALRARGVDVWLDQWEMVAGDSLVDKVFDGIEDASVVIIVLSAVSVAKPWVREELNASFVKRIEGRAKLIPVVLDRCDIPPALKSTVRVSVPNTGDFSKPLESVVDSIFGIVRKPPLGEPAAYLADPGLRIGGLSPTDSAVLSALYEAFAHGQKGYVDPDILGPILAAQGIGTAAAVDSLAVLEHMRYVEVLHALGRGASVQPASIRPHGISAVLGEREAALTRDVGFAILNDEHRRSEAIAVALGIPESLAGHAMKRLEDGGHLTLSNEISPMKSVAMIAPTLRRVLDID